MSYRSVYGSVVGVVLMASGGLALSAGAQPGETPAPVSTADAITSPDQLPAKTGRYHQALRRSPQPGLIFDRFCDSWLAERSDEELEQFLERQAEAGEPADQLILGFYFAREGRNVQALRVFRDTLERHPGNAAAWFFKAQIEAATLDFDTALSDLDAALAADPDPDLAADAAELRGRLLVRTGRRAEGLAAWAQLLEQRPDDPELYENLIVVHVEEGLFDPALEILGRLIERTADPQKKVGRQLWRGDILQQAGRKDAALKTYEHALIQVGSGGWLERQVLSQIEQVYRRDQELEAFSQRLTALTEQHPERIEIARRRARVLSELGQTDAAIAQWRALLERAPGDRELRRAFADVLADAGQTQPAIDLIEALLTDRPGDGDLRLRLASLYHQAERPEDAVAQVRVFVEQSDGSLSSAIRATRTLERFELDGPAEAILRGYVDSHPEEPAAQQALAELLYRVDQKDQAIAIWRDTALETQDRGELLGAARALSSRGEAETAQAVLLDRVEDFAEDAEVLGALAEVSLRGGEPEPAVAWLRPWLRSTAGGEALGRAVDTAARLARSAKQDDALIRELSAAAESDTPPTDGEVWLLATLYEARGDSPAADAVLARGLDRDPAPETLIYAKAGLLADRGQYALAADALLPLVERPGGMRSALVRELIDLYARDFRLEDALAWIERWKQASPGSISPWLRQAALLSADGQNEVALKVLEDAGRRFPDDVSIASKLADTYAQEGREADAVRVVWKLYDAADSTAAKLSWVRKLAELTRFSDGSDRLIRRLELRRDQDRRSVEPYLALAELYRVLDRYEERRAALMEAARVQPEDLDLLLTIARVEQQAGELEQAVGTLRRALPLDSSGRIRRQLAILSIELGQTSEAVDLFNDTAPTSQDVSEMIDFANALMSQNEWEIAADFLGSRVTAHPDDYRLAYLHGVALRELFQTQAASDAFIAVVDIDREPPGVQTPAQNPFAQYTTMFQRMLPAESLTLLRQQWANYRATSYRTQQQHIGFAGRGGVGVFIQPPTSWTDAHDLAIAHLRGIAYESDDAARQRIVAGLEQRGVRLAAVMIDLPPDAHGGVMFSGELLETHRDEPAVLALGVMMGAFQETQISPELYTHAATLFEDDWPELTLLTLMGQLAEVGVSDSALVADIWPRLEAQLEQIEEPAELMIPALAAYAGLMPGQGSPIDLTDEQRGVLSNKLRSWYRKLDAQSQYRPWLMQSVVASILQTEDWPELARFINDETARHRAQTSGRAVSGQAAQLRAMHRRGQGPIQELNFPPIGLVSIPAELAGLWGAENMFGMMETPVDHTALLAALPEETPPLVRALIAGAADDDEALTAALDPVLTGPQSTLDAWLVRAAWDGQRGEPSRAMNALVRASYLPMSRGDRTRVDGATVAYAITIGDALSDDARSAAQRAALRLRQSAITFEERSVVIEALAALGLDEEAERMEERLVAAPSGSASGVFSRGRGGVTGPGTERIGDLLVEGRRGDAVKLAARAVAGFAQQLAQGNSWVLQQHDAEELLALLETRGLTEDVIAEADPGDTARGQRRVMFGLTLEVLGEIDRAAQVYRATLDQRPDPGAAIRLFQLEAERGEVEAAADALAAVPTRMLTPVVNQLTQQISHHPNNGPRRPIRFAQATALWLEKMEDPAAVPVAWTAQLFETLATSQHHNGESLPHLYDAEAAPKFFTALASGDPADEEDPALGYNLVIQRERYDAHDRLARAQLQSPSTAPAAAARLMLTAQLRGEPVTPQIDVVEAALLLPPSRRGGPPAIQQYYHHGYTPQLLPLRSAYELLARHAAAQGEPARIEAAAQTLRDQRRRDQAEMLESLYALYSAPAESLVPAAEAWLTSLRGPARQSIDDPLRPVVDAWTDGGRPEAELGPVMVAAYTDPRANWFHQPMISMMEYARGIAARDGRVAAAAFLEAFAAEYLGPAEERVALIEKHFQSNNWRAGSINARMQLFVSTLQQAAGAPELGWAVLEQLGYFAASTAAADRVSFDERVAEVFGNLFEQAFDGPDPAAEIIAALEGSPLLRDGDAFESFAFDGDREERSGLGLVRGLGDRNHAEGWDAVRDEILDWLDDQPATLGTALTASALRDDSLADTLAGLIPMQDTLAGLDPDTLVQVVAAIPPLRGNTQVMSPDLLALADLLGGVRGDQLADRAQEFLDIRAIQPHSNQAWELGESLPPLLLNLYREDKRELVVEMLTHWDGLMEKQRRSQGYSHHETAETLLREVVDTDSGDSESIEEHLVRLRFFTETASDNALSLRLESWTLSESRSRLDELMDDLEPLAGREDSQPRRFATGLNFLADDLGDRHAGPLVYGLYREARDRHNHKNYAEGFALLTKYRLDGPAADADAEALDAGGLWTAAEAALRLARLDESNRGEEREEDRVFVSRYLESLAADDRLPASVRLGLLREVVDDLGRQTPPAVATAGGRLLIDTFEQQPERVDVHAVEHLVLALWAVPEAPGRPTDTEILDCYLARMSARGSARRGGDSPHVSLPSSYHIVGGTQQSLASPRAGLAVLEMALKLDPQQSAVEKLMRLDDRTLSAAPAAWALLVEHGRADLAAAAIRRHYDDAQPARLWGIYYTPELAGRTPELLAELDREQDAGLRYFAQAALATLVDPGDDPHRLGSAAGADASEDSAEGSGRSARLVALAERFDEIPLDRTALREAVLIMLSSDDRAAALLAVPLAEATRSVTLADLAPDNSSATENKKQLVYASLFGPLLESDPAPLLHQIQALFDTADQDRQNRWQYDSLYRDIRRFTRTLLRPRGSLDLSPDNLAALREVWGLLLDPPNDQFHRGRIDQADVARMLALYGLDLESDVTEFDAWYQGLPDRLRPGYPHSNVHRRVLKEIANLPGMDDERRKEMVVRAILGGINTNKISALEHMIYGDKILTADELAEYADTFNDILLPDGKIRFASALQRQDHPTSDQAWDRAESAVAEAEGEGAYERYRVLLLEQLGRHDRLDRAAVYEKDWTPRNAKIAKRLAAVRKKYFSAPAEPTPAAEPSPAAPPAAENDAPSEPALDVAFSSGPGKQAPALP
ncbi:MAG: tetratricopeptide repeat protein [Planctomycetota bacterium]